MPMTYIHKAWFTFISDYLFLWPLGVQQRCSLRSFRITFIFSGIQRFHFYLAIPDTTPGSRASLLTFLFPHLLGTPLFAVLLPYLAVNSTGTCLTLCFVAESISKTNETHVHNIPKTNETHVPQCVKIERNSRSTMCFIIIALESMYWISPTSINGQLIISSHTRLLSINTPHNQNPLTAHFPTLLFDRRISWHVRFREACTYIGCGIKKSGFNIHWRILTMDKNVF